MKTWIRSTALLLLTGCWFRVSPARVQTAPVRFVALGDTGEGNKDQVAVAQVIQTVCAAQGCDFVLLLGDNIYNTGVESTADAQWQDKFEIPYAEVDLPFYASLGNHDYGGVSEEERALAQVAYSEVSEKWNLPDRWYRHTHENVDFYGLDTQVMVANTLLPDAHQEQRAWMDATWANDPLAEWAIAYGHHPYLSNGVHGNAGAFDGLPEVAGSFTGVDLKTFFDESVCGRADLYLCGHDHDREWLVETCEGTQLIVSGAGAKLRDFTGSQPVHWGDDTTEGFVWIEIDNLDIRVQFWNKTGVMDHEGGWTKADNHRTTRQP